LWRIGRGRIYRSSQYDSWRTTAGWELKLQRPPRVEGPVEVSIALALGRPDNRKRDLDNAAGNAVLDLLVADQVIECDSLVTSITSSWDAEAPPGHAIVIIRPAMAAETIAS
jgi:Holliday junction resolvase RusA-like endonuclease